jgi:hypothetical protein
MSDFLSSVPLDRPRFAVSLLDGLWEPVPSSELENLDWGQFIEAIAPRDGLDRLADKSKARYFVPCLFKIAPLIGKTLENAQAAGLPVVGKQRSAGHVTSTLALVFDMDGMSKDEFKKILARLDAEGVTYLAYSSYSHGNPEKPGYRARCLIPIDQSADRQTYTKAWSVVNQEYFSGVADTTSSKLHQAQGTWVTNPAWADKAFRIDHRGGVLSLNKLVAATTHEWAVPGARLSGTGQIATLPTYHTFTADDPLRLQDASQYWNANDYSRWIKTITCLKAMAGHLDEDALRELAVSYSAQGDLEAQALNTRPAYDPRTIFDRTRPMIPASVAFATLLAMARDGAEALVRNESIRDGKLSERGLKAAAYLRDNHPAKFAAIREEAGAC